MSRHIRVPAARPFLFLIALILSVLVVACGGSQPTASSVSTTQGQRAIATAIALRASESGVAVERPAQAVPSGPQTVASIMASAPASRGLDGLHLAKGVGCEACHGNIPSDGKPVIPNTAKCLSCHGSYDALAAKTAALGPMNPHKTHTGRLDCDRCHSAHRPFEYSCNNCHDFPIPEKYRGDAKS